MTHNHLSLSTFLMSVTHEKTIIITATCTHTCHYTEWEWCTLDSNFSVVETVCLSGACHLHSCRERESRGRRGNTFNEVSWLEKHKQRVTKDVTLTTCVQCTYTCIYRLSQSLLLATYFVMGLLMCGKRLGVCWALEGGVAKPVPHLGGMCRTQWPLEGSICLRVDHCSQRDDGAEANTVASSAARENDFSGASEGGTQ